MVREMDVLVAKRSSDELRLNKLSYDNAPRRVISRCGQFLELPHDTTLNPIDGRFGRSPGEFHVRLQLDAYRIATRPGRRQARGYVGL